MNTKALRIVQRSILLATLLATAASTSAFSQNKTIKPGPILSDGRIVGNMLFVAGLKGKPATGSLADLDIGTQTQLTLDAIKSVVEEAGFKMTDIVSANV
jgi:2-iminobutanoate/2-iminopropanoate deaminase